MGQANADTAIRATLTNVQPSLVLTCGFAGGLNPKYRVGEILFDADDSILSQRLLLNSAHRATFHCTDTIATTSEAKHALHLQTGADAVEMESGIIRRLCAEKRIPSATIRIISDGVNDSLPIDFAKFLTAEKKVHVPSLALHVLMRPARLIALLKFHHSLRRLAAKLAHALITALPTGSHP